MLLYLYYVQRYHIVIAHASLVCGMDAIRQRYIDTLQPQYHLTLIWTCQHGERLGVELTSHLSSWADNQVSNIIQGWLSLFTIPEQMGH